jgi:hypothetical protein
MTHWNYRIVKTSDGAENWYGIYEVYYNDEGSPWTRTVHSPSFASVDEMKWAYSEALAHDVINDEEIHGLIPE